METVSTAIRTARSGIGVSGDYRSQEVREAGKRVFAAQQVLMCIRPQMRSNSWRGTGGIGAGRRRPNAPRQKDVTAGGVGDCEAGTIEEPPVGGLSPPVPQP